MDRGSRAATDAPARVTLSAAARKGKDKESARRARRKGYARGLTTASLQSSWRDATAGGGTMVENATRTHAHSNSG